MGGFLLFLYFSRVCSDGKEFLSDKGERGGGRQQVISHVCGGANEQKCGQEGVGGKGTPWVLLYCLFKFNVL